MEFIRRALPSRLSPRLWLFSLPSALLSFERRQGIPKMPIGRLRLLGIPLIGAAAVLALWPPRPPQDIPTARTLRDRLLLKPGITAGLLLLAGAALLLRSFVLALYSVAIAFAAGGDAVTIEEPRPDLLLRRFRTDV